MTCFFDVMYVADFLVVFAADWPVSSSSRSAGRGSADGRLSRQALPQNFHEIDDVATALAVRVFRAGRSHDILALLRLSCNQLL